MGDESVFRSGQSRSAEGDDEEIKEQTSVKGNIGQKEHETTIGNNVFEMDSNHEEENHSVSAEVENEDSEDQRGTDSKEERKCFSSVNRSLLHCKLLYFCYQSALGALWPYLPLYFKQLFLTPRQVGTIVASRTLVQFVCVPFWTGIADKYKKHKLVMLIAIFAWLVSTMALLIVPAEQPKACFKMGLKRTAENDDLEDAWFDFTVLDKLSNDRKELSVKRVRKDINYGVSIFKTNSTNLTAKYSAYDPDQHVLDTSRLYLLLLLITILGMMISAPSLILVDICTLQRLRDKPHHFGHQALWGSLGFGLFAFTIGVMVNFIHTMNHCTRKADINFIPCFYVFAFFMTLSLLVGSQLDYEYEDSNKQRPSFLKGLKSIHDIHLATLLVVTFYCGMGSGFISTFLFWHLREMGGIQILMALVTLMNSTAEVLFYLLSDRIIHCIGHFRVIYIGLVCFAIRFFYYSFLRVPWMVLPVEVTHGMTSAAVRSALVSYLGKEPGSGSVLQGVFSGVHSGLGFSIGGLAGGIMVHEFGHSITFLIFGEVSLVILFSFILVNNIWPHPATNRQCKESDANENELQSVKVSKQSNEQSKMEDVELDSTSLDILNSLRGLKGHNARKCE